jgi:glycerate dehydrogenase
MRIVFLDRHTFHPDIVFSAATLPDAVWQDYPLSAPHEIVLRAAGAGVIVTNKARLPAELLEQLPQLKLVAVAATGVDHVDLATAERLGIAVCNVTGYAVHTVPEHVFSLLLALRRHLLRYAVAARDGRWSRSGTFCLHDWPIADLAGSTLGIVGSGKLGDGVAALAQAFGMRVLRAERPGATAIRPGRASFAQVLAEADAVSLHVPLTAETRNLIGAAELARMKPSAVLINTARGGVVDETALLAALRAGRLAGAALDVLSVEPPPADHPLFTADLPNLIVTPHVAWASRQAQQTLANEVVANIAAFQRGERRNRIV